MAENLFKDSDPGCNVPAVPVVDFKFVEDCYIEPTPPPIFECIKPPILNEPCIKCPEFATGATINVGYPTPGDSCPTEPRIAVRVEKTGDDPCQYDFQVNLDIPIPRVPCPIINVKSFSVDALGPGAADCPECLVVEVATCAERDQLTLEAAPVGSTARVADGCGVNKPYWQRQADGTWNKIAAPPCQSRFVITTSHRPPEDCNDPGECQFDVELDIKVPIPRIPCPEINVNTFDVQSRFTSPGCCDSFLINGVVSGATASGPLIAGATAPMAFTSVQGRLYSISDPGDVVAAAVKQQNSIIETRFDYVEPAFAGVIIAGDGNDLPISSHTSVFDNYSTDPAVAQSIASTILALLTPEQVELANAGKLIAVISRSFSYFEANEVDGPAFAAISFGRIQNGMWNLGHTSQSEQAALAYNTFKNISNKPYFIGSSGFGAPATNSLCARAVQDSAVAAGVKLVVYEGDANSTLTDQRFRRFYPNPPWWVPTSSGGIANKPVSPKACDYFGHPSAAQVRDMLRGCYVRKNAPPADFSKIIVYVTNLANVDVQDIRLLGGGKVAYYSPVTSQTQYFTLDPQQQKLVAAAAPNPATDGVMEVTRNWINKGTDAAPAWKEITQVTTPDICESTFTVTPRTREPVDCNDPGGCAFDIDLAITVPIPRIPCPIINVKSFSVSTVSDGTTDCPECLVIEVATCAERDQLTLEAAPVGSTARVADGCGNDKPYWQRQADGTWVAAEPPCQSRFVITAAHRPPEDCNDPGECQFDIELDIKVPIPVPPCPQIDGDEQVNVVAGYADTPCVTCTSDLTVADYTRLAEIPATDLKPGMYVAVQDRVTTYTLNEDRVTWTPDDPVRLVYSAAELDAIPLAERLGLRVELVNPTQFFKRTSLGDWVPMSVPVVDIDVESAAALYALTAEEAPIGTVARVAIGDQILRRTSHNLGASSWELVDNPVPSQTVATEADLPGTDIEEGAVVQVQNPTKQYVWRGKWVPDDILVSATAFDEQDLKNVADRLPANDFVSGIRARVLWPTDRYRLDPETMTWVPARCPRAELGVISSKIQSEDCNTPPQCRFDLGLELSVPVPKPPCPEINIDQFEVTAGFADCTECVPDFTEPTYDSAKTLVIEQPAGTIVKIETPTSEYRWTGVVWQATAEEEIVSIVVPDDATLATLEINETYAGVKIIVGARATVTTPATLFRLEEDLQTWTPVTDVANGPAKKQIYLETLAAAKSLPFGQRYAGLYVKIAAPVTEYVMDASGEWLPAPPVPVLDIVDEIARDALDTAALEIGTIVRLRRPAEALVSAGDGKFYTTSCPKKNQFTIRKKTIPSENCDEADTCVFDVGLELAVLIPRIPCPIINVKTFKVDTHFNDDDCCTPATQTTVIEAPNAAARDVLSFEEAPAGSYVKTTNDGKFWLRTHDEAKNIWDWEETDDPNGPTCKNRFRVTPKHRPPEDCQDPGQCEFDIELQIDVPIPRIPCPIINTKFTSTIGYSDDPCVSCDSDVEVDSFDDLANISEQFDGMRAKLKNPGTNAGRYRLTDGVWTPDPCPTSNFAIITRHRPGEDCNDPGQCEFEIVLELVIPIPKLPCPEITATPPSVRVANRDCLANEEPPAITVDTTCDLYDIPMSARTAGMAARVAETGTIYTLSADKTTWAPSIRENRFTITTRHESNKVKTVVGSIAERDSLTGIKYGEVVAVETDDEKTYWRRGDCIHAPKWSQIEFSENCDPDAPKDSPQCVFDLGIEILVPLPPCPEFKTKIHADYVYKGLEDDCCPAEIEVQTQADLIVLGPLGDGNPLDITPVAGAPVFTPPREGITAKVKDNKTRWRWITKEGGWRPAKCESYIAVSPRPQCEDNEDNKCEFDVVVDILVPIPTPPCPAFTTNVAAGAFYGDGGKQCTSCPSTLKFDTINNLTALGPIGAGQPRLLWPLGFVFPPEGITAFVKQNNTRWRWITDEGGWRDAPCTSYFAITPRSAASCDNNVCQFDVVLDIVVPVPQPPCPVFNTRVNSVTFCTDDQYPRSQATITQRQQLCSPDDFDQPKGCVFDFDFQLEIPCPVMFGGFINVTPGPPGAGGGWLMVNPACNGAVPNPGRACPQANHFALDVVDRDRQIFAAARNNQPIPPGSIFKLDHPLPHGSYWQYLGGVADFALQWQEILCDPPNAKPVCGFEFGASIVVPYCEPQFFEDDDDGFHTGVRKEDRFKIYYIKPTEKCPGGVAPQCPQPDRVVNNIADRDALLGEEPGIVDAVDHEGAPFPLRLTPGLKFKVIGNDTTLYRLSGRIGDPCPVLPLRVLTSNCRPGTCPEGLPRMAAGAWVGKLGKAAQIGNNAIVKVQDAYYKLVVQGGRVCISEPGNHAWVLIPCLDKSSSRFIIAPEKDRQNNQQLPCRYRYAIKTIICHRQPDNIASCTQYYGDPCCDTGCPCTMEKCCVEGADNPDSKEAQPDGSKDIGNAFYNLPPNAPGDVQEFRALPDAAQTVIPADLPRASLQQQQQPCADCEKQTQLLTTINDTGLAEPAEQPIMHAAAPVAGAEFFDPNDDPCVKKAIGIVGCTQSVYGPISDKGYRPYKFLELRIREEYPPDRLTPPKIKHNIEAALNCLHGGVVRVRKAAATGGTTPTKLSMPPENGMTAVDNPTMASTVTVVPSPSTELAELPDDLGSGTVIIEQNRVNVVITLKTAECDSSSSGSGSGTSGGSGSGTSGGSGSGTSSDLRMPPELTTTAVDNPILALNSANSELSPALLESLIRAINTNHELKAAIRQVVNQPD